MVKARGPDLLLPKRVSPVVSEPPTDQYIRLLRARGLTVIDRRGTFALRPGTKGPPYPTRDGGLDAIIWFVLHHTGMGPARPTVDEVAAFQISPSAQDAFPSIAYSQYGEVDGTVVICFDLELEPWSQGLGSPFVDRNGEGVNNDRGLSYCISGQDPTDPQWQSAVIAHECAQQVLGRSILLTSHGHVDPGTTACAGPVINSRVGFP